MKELKCLLALIEFTALSIRHLLLTEGLESRILLDVVLRASSADVAQRIGKQIELFTGPKDNGLIDM